MTRARNLAGLGTVTAQPTVTTPVHLGPLGVVTATKYYGTFDHTNIIATSIATTDIQIAGITTGLNVSGVATFQNGFISAGIATFNNIGDINVTGVATFAGNVSIAGTLTYEDVTDIDSVGLVTARQGVYVSGGTRGVDISQGGLNVTAGISTLQAVTATTGTFTGDLTIADSIVHSGDTDTKIRFPSGDDISFETAGSQKFAINSTGTLTASGADGKLNLTNTGSDATEQTAYFYTSNSGTHNQIHIKTSTNNGGDPYIKFDGGGQDMIVGTRYAGTTNNLLVLGPGNNPDTTSGIFVKGTGVVGVGTDNPAYQLDCCGDGGGSFSAITNSTNGVLSVVGKNSGGSVSAISRIKSYPDGSSNQSHMAFETRNSSNTMVEAMRITSSQHVGIGSAIPDDLLTLAAISGGSKITLLRSNTAANNNAFGSIYFDNMDKNDVASIIAHRESAEDDAYLAFSTQATGGALTERLRIHSSGKLSVGTASAGYGQWSFVNIGSSGADASGGETGMTIRSDEGFTNTDVTGSDNWTLKLRNNAYAGGGVSGNQGTVAKLLFSGVTSNGHNSSVVMGVDTQGTGGSKGDFFLVPGGGSEALRVDANGRVLIGNSTSMMGDQKLQVTSTSSTGSILLGRWSNSNYSSYLNFFKSRHTSIVDGGGTVVQSGDILGTIAFYGDDATSGGDNRALAAEIKCLVNGSPGTADMPGKLRFSCSNDGSASPTTRMEVSEGGVTAYGPLDVQCSSSSTVNAGRFYNTTNNTSANTMVQLKTYSNGGGDNYIHFDAGGSNMVVGQFYGGTTNNKVMIGTGDSPSGGVKGVHVDGNGNIGLADGVDLGILDDNSGNAWSWQYSKGSIQHKSERANGWSLQYMNISGASSGSDNRYFQFLWTSDSGNTTVGYIRTDGSNTQYETSSDYRLKENIVDISDGITRLKQLKPRRFNWIKDETNKVQDGFLAHEVSNLIPEAVSGTKDQVVTQAEVDADVNFDSKPAGTPIYQSMDYAKVTPLLTAALQEAIAKIEVLESEVAALKGS